MSMSRMREHTQQQNRWGHLPTFQTFLSSQEITLKMWANIKNKDHTNN